MPVLSCVSSQSQEVCLLGVTTNLTYQESVVESSLPYSQVHKGTGELIEQENLVEFRLIYEGEILSSGNRSTVSNKHAIRKALHPQLRQLWKLHDGIKQYARMEYHPAKWTAPINTIDERTEAGIRVIGREWNRAKIDFVPLVTDKFALRCALDIVLLRPGDERNLLKRGDIDGQLKTLFDALRIPENESETGGAPATPDEIPFYCLLSDDKLITEVKVTDDHLLLLPHSRAVKATDAFAVIHVQINHRGGGYTDRFFD
jgi:hypothetical protein